MRTRLSTIARGSLLSICATQLLTFGCASEDPAAMQGWTAGPAMGMAGSAAVTTQTPATAAPSMSAATPGAMMTPPPAAMAPASMPGVAEVPMGAMGAAAMPPAAVEECKYRRKNVKALTMQERSEFVAAVLKLKEMPSPYDATMNWYDQFVYWHIALQICDPNSTAPMMMGHGAPMFLPWHRQHLLLFDQALDMVTEAPIATPYWDWTDRDSPSIIFTEDFMGGDGVTAMNGAVMSGPFRADAFVIKIDPPGLSGGGSPFIQRIMGSPESLPTPAEVEAALQVPLYDVAPWTLSSDPMMSFRSRLEGNGGGFAIGGGGESCPASGVMPLPIGGMALHNRVHVWVNGSLLTAASPNDPVFFLHHNNVDRIWAQWQDIHGIDSYVPKNGEFPANNVDDPMMPFDHDGMVVTAADVADNKKLGVCFE
jgi:tyrosinase